MVATGRWQAAQSYEQGYWEAQANKIAAGAEQELAFYDWRAQQLRERLDRLGLSALTAGTSRVVEVGSGPVGLASYFPASRAVLFDPLQDFYSSNAALSALRNPRAEYRRARGEELPCAAGEFDLAVIENCIDHVQDCHGVMRELHRVLAPGGILYLTVNCRSGWGYYVHRVISSLKLDPGHPHTFTPPRVEALMRRHGFSVVDMQVGSYEEAYEEDRSSTNRRARIKAALGVSEYLASVVCRKG